MFRPILIFLAFTGCFVFRNKNKTSTSVQSKIDTLQETTRYFIPVPVLSRGETLRIENAKYVFRYDTIRHSIDVFVVKNKPVVYIDTIRNYYEKMIPVETYKETPNQPEKSAFKKFLRSFGIIIGFVFFIVVSSFVLYALVRIFFRI